MSNNLDFDYQYDNNSLDPFINSDVKPNFYSNEDIYGNASTQYDIYGSQQIPLDQHHDNEMLEDNPITFNYDDQVFQESPKITDQFYSSSQEGLLQPLEEQASPSSEQPPQQAPASKSKKKYNEVGSYSCEETKNLSNFAIPFIENGLHKRSVELIKFLPCFNQKGNKKSTTFLNQLGKEVSQMIDSERQKFTRMLKFIINDFKKMALNKKIGTCYTLLKYADVLQVIISNPNCFDSPKDARRIMMMMS